MKKLPEKQCKYGAPEPPYETPAADLHGIKVEAGFAASGVEVSGPSPQISDMDNWDSCE